MRGAVPEARDAREAAAEPLGERGRSQQDRRGAVGDPAAVLLAQAAFDHRVQLVVGPERAGREPPVAGLGEGIPAPRGRKRARRTARGARGRVRTARRTRKRRRRRARATGTSRRRLRARPTRRTLGARRPAARRRCASARPRRPAPGRSGPPRGPRTRRGPRCCRTRTRLRAGSTGTPSSSGTAATSSPPSWAWPVNSSAARLPTCATSTSSAATPGVREGGGHDLGEQLEDPAPLLRVVAREVGLRPAQHEHGHGLTPDFPAVAA